MLMPLVVGSTGALSHDKQNNNASSILRIQCNSLQN